MKRREGGGRESIVRKRVLRGGSFLGITKIPEIFTKSDSRVECPPLSHKYLIIINAKFGRTLSEEVHSVVVFEIGKKV